jgi:hypothetical protein
MPAPESRTTSLNRRVPVQRSKNPASLLFEWNAGSFHILTTKERLYPRYQRHLFFLLLLFELLHKLQA